MSEIDDLKQEVRRLTETVKDTNAQVHSMRRSQRWHTFFRIVWMLTIVGVTGYVYLTFVQPYVAVLMESYGDAREFQLQIQDWFAQFGNRAQ